MSGWGRVLSSPFAPKLAPRVEPVMFTRWLPAHENQPWCEGGFPLFAMSFPLAVTTAAAAFRGHMPDGYVLPRPLIYSRS